MITVFHTKVRDIDDTIADATRLLQRLLSSSPSCIGMNALAKTLERNRTLASLNLSFNALDDYAIDLIAKPLVRHRGLQEIYIGGNKMITDNGALTIEKAILDAEQSNIDVIVSILDLSHITINKLILNRLKYKLARNVNHCTIYCVIIVINSASKHQ